MSYPKVVVLGIFVLMSHLRLLSKPDERGMQRNIGQWKHAAARQNVVLSDELSNARLEEVFNRARYLDSIGLLDSSRKTYKKAFSLAREKNEWAYVINAMPAVQRLYERIASETEADYLRIRSERYITRELYLTSTSLSKNTKGEWTIQIPIGTSLGLEDKIVSLYGASEKKVESERELAFITEGDIDTQASDFTTYILRNGPESWPWQPRDGDLLLIELKTADFETDLIAQAYFRNIWFKGNYGEKAVGLALIMSKDYEFYRDFIRQFYLYQLLEVYEAYADDTTAILHQKAESGLFTGISGLEAMKMCRWPELEQFFRYAFDHWVTYSADNYSFSEAMFTWIINNAPMSEEQFMDYFLNMDAELRQERLKLYVPQIEKNEWLHNWLKQAEMWLNDRSYPDALLLSELCLETALLLDHPLWQGQSLLLQSRSYMALQQEQQALKLLERASDIIRAHGDQANSNRCDQLLKSWSGEKKIEVVVQGGHSMPFEFVFHPDGEYYYTGGWDGFIKMYDFRSGLMIRQLKAHDLMIANLRISRDGRFLLSTDDDGVLRLSNAFTLEEIWSYHHPSEFIRDADINEDGSLIAFCSDDEKVYLLDPEKRKLIQELTRHQQRVVAVKFHPRGDILLSAGRDSMVYTWNLSDFSERGWYKEGSGIYALQLSPDGRSFATVRMDTSIGIWDFFAANRTGWAQTVFGKVGSYLYYAKPVFSPDNRYLCMAYQGDREYISLVRLSDLSVQHFRNLHADHLSALAFHPGGNTLVSVSHDLKVILYDLSNYVFKESKTLRTIKRRTPAVATYQSNFDSSGQHMLVVIGGIDPMISTLNLQNGSQKLLHEGLLSGDQAQYLDRENNHWRFFDYKRKLWLMDMDGRVLSQQSTMIDRMDYYRFGKNGRQLYVLNAGSDTFHRYTLDQVIKHQSYSLPFRIPTYLFGWQILCVSEPMQKVWFVQKTPFLYELNLQSGQVDSFQLTGKKDHLIRILSTETDGELIVEANTFIGLYQCDGQKWKWKIPGDQEEGGYTAIAVSADGKYLATASPYYVLQVRELPEGKLVMESRDFDYFISSLKFNPRYSLLSVTCEDLRLSVYDYLQGKRLMNIYAQNNGELILMDEENHYWASKESLSGLAFKIKEGIYPVEQFDLYFNKPAKVLSVLPMADERYLKVLQQAGDRRMKGRNLTDSAVSIALPNAMIRNRADIPAITKEKELNLIIESSDFAYGLDRMFIQVNGVPLTGSTGIPLSDSVQRIRYELLLSEGANLIKVWCTNRKGLESLKDQLEITLLSEKVKPALYFASIAVSDYEDNDYDLKYPVKDAGDLYKAFTADSSLWREVHDLQLHDTLALKDNLQLLQDFFSKAGVDDQVVLFVAGHGLLDDDFSFYFATEDMDFEEPAKRGISYRQIESLLQQTAARKRLLLMDACHSGEVDTLAGSITVGRTMPSVVSGSRGGKAKRMGGQLGLQNSFNLMRELFADLGTGNGIQVISAASGDSYALESDQWQNGVFTYAVIKGLDGAADLNRDGSVKVSELREYVIEEVDQLTAGRQRPTVRSENVEFDFILN